MQLQAQPGVAEYLFEADRHVGRCAGVAGWQFLAAAVAAHTGMFSEAEFFCSGHGRRMQHRDPVTREIGDVEGKDAVDAVHQHRRCQAGVIDLRA